jgi:putative membrane protein
MLHSAKLRIGVSGTSIPQCANCRPDVTLTSLRAYKFVWSAAEKSSHPGRAHDGRISAAVRCRSQGVPNALLRAAVAKAQAKVTIAISDKQNSFGRARWLRASRIAAFNAPDKYGILSMNRASVTRRVARFGFAPMLLSLATGIGIVNAQAAAPMEAPAPLNAVDFNFVGQANLGAPFQVDSGRLAEKKGGSTAIRKYAHLMVTSHIPVADALTAILQRKNVTPSNTLLHGAYDAMISTLEGDHGAAFDRDYVNGQVEYQKGNAALFREEIANGNDPDLKKFASETLPKIEDHLKRALRLAGAASGNTAAN